MYDHEKSMGKHNAPVAGGATGIRERRVRSSSKLVCPSVLSSYLALLCLVQDDIIDCRNISDLVTRGFFTPQ